MRPLHMTFCYQSRHAHLSPATLNHCFTQLEPFVLLPAHMHAHTRTKNGVHFGLRQEQRGAVDLFITRLLLKSSASQVQKTWIDFLFFFFLENISSPREQKPVMRVGEKILVWLAILRDSNELMSIIGWRVETCIPVGTCETELLYSHCADSRATAMRRLYFQHWTADPRAPSSGLQKRCLSSTKTVLF